MRTFDSADFSDLFSQLREAVVMYDGDEQEQQVCTVLQPMLVQEVIDDTSPITVERKGTVVQSFIGESFAIQRVKVEAYAHSYRVTIQAKDATGSSTYMFVGRLSSMPPALVVEDASIRSTVQMRL